MRGAFLAFWFAATDSAMPQPILAKQSARRVRASDSGLHRSPPGAQRGFRARDLFRL